MIPVMAIVRGVKALYPYAVFGYELIRSELRKSRGPAPQPLPYRDVEHIRKQIDRATSFKVQPPPGA